MKEKTAVIFILLAGSLWGIIGIFINTLTDLGYNRYEIIFIRAAMTALCIFLWLFLKAPSNVSIHPKDIWIFLCTGILSFVCFNLCYLQCILETGMSVAAVLLYTAPIFVMLFSVIFFHEKLTFRKILALTAAFAGCICVTGVLNGNQGVTLRGILLGIGSGLGYALYTIFGQVGLKKYNSLTLTAWSFLFAALGMVPLIRFDHLFSVSVSNLPAFVLLILCGLVTNVIPYVLYTGALTKIDGSRASIIACIEPIIATLAGVLIFGENLTVSGIIGVLLVLSAVVLLNTD